MLKRLRVGLARILMRGTECAVVRKEYVARVLGLAVELQEYVDRSGALQDSSRIHAWRRVYALSTMIRDQAVKSEVAS